MKDFPNGGENDTADGPYDPADLPAVGKETPDQISGSDQQPKYGGGGFFQSRFLALFGSKLTFPQKPFHAGPLDTDPDKQTNSDTDQYKHSGNKTGGYQGICGEKT